MLYRCGTEGNEDVVVIVTIVEVAVGITPARTDNRRIVVIRPALKVFPGKYYRTWSTNNLIISEKVSLNFQDSSGNFSQGRLPQVCRFIALTMLETYILATLILEPPRT